MEYQKKLPILIENEEIDGFCVDARKLWEQLGKPQGQFTHWANRKIVKKKNKTNGHLVFIENIDYLTVRQKCPIANTKGYKENFDYLLTIDCAKNVAIVENTDIGIHCRKYFILIEKLVKANKDWFEVRNPERKAYKELCNKLSENIFLHSGRYADKYDYAREANILNIIATGSTAQEIKLYLNIQPNELTRDSLEIEYNERLAFLQEQDMLLIGMNLPIVDRIKMLISMFDIKYPKAKPLISSIDREDYLAVRDKLITDLTEHSIVSVA